MDPPADIRKAGELARQALAKEHLSPQVARLPNWLMSYVLVLEREFDGALAAADKTVAMAPNDTFMLSRLMMVLVQVGRPWIRRFSGLTKLRRGIRHWVGATITVGVGRIWYWGDLERRWML